MGDFPIYRSSYPIFWINNYHKTISQNNKNSHSYAKGITSCTNLIISHPSGPPKPENPTPNTEKNTPSRVDLDNKFP